MKRIAKIALAVALVLAMSINAFAFSNFVPSISNKKAPIIIKINAVMADGSTTSIATDNLTVVPCQEALSNEDFEEAYKELESTDSFTALVPGLEAALPADVEDEDLIVRDVFDIIPGQTITAIVNAGGYIDVTFELPGVDVDDTIIAIHKDSKTGWEVLPSSVPEKDTVIVTMDSFSPVAFLALRSVTIDPEGPASPSTGEEVAPLALGLALAMRAAR